MDADRGALSLQMKRLEETVQASLLRREGRRLAPTPAGQTLLTYAREILIMNGRAVSALNGDALAGPARVGLVQDFAETLLSGMLARFSQLNVRASNMSALAERPDHFLAWLRAHQGSDDGFVSRRRYGQYLRACCTQGNLRGPARPDDLT
ncbi:FAD/NAD(P)-binding protein [Phenylobacterium sp.]|uniref:FAD/NAD(P)-binding protein n=1 Tax=Phenylobacterium sp. TaxID=1871053 RepID=UPI0025E9A7D5|nr:FAD/NAD(P)-binding protein [Phenylobacterium sp.]